MIEQPSTQSLLIQMEVNGQPLATGTAFVVKDETEAPWLITNRHNLAGRSGPEDSPMSPTGATPDTVRIMHNMAGRLGLWIPVAEPLHNEAGEPLWLEHPDLGRLVDVVALPLTATADIELLPHDHTATTPDVAIRTTTELFIVGFPFGITSGGYLAVWTRGTVASEYGVDFDDLPVFLVDARTRRGQSGAPVIFYAIGGMVAMTDGGSGVFSGPVQRLLGVYSGRINEESDLGIVWRASVIEDLLSRGVRPPAS